MTRKRATGKRCTVLIMGTLSIMLPTTLNAAYMENCKDRLMDVFTKVCATDRFKRGIEKFDLQKADYKRLELTESVDLSFQPEEAPGFLNIPDKRDIVPEISKPIAIPIIPESEIVDVVSGPKQDSSYNGQHNYPYKRHAPNIPRAALSVETDKLGFEMTDEELHELYNDLNDRLPRSFTQDEWMKILRDFAKTCCYKDNICDSKNVDILCS
ncbi:hypothetical protein KPH14_004565 [Odynerus spinipes]|uniref:Uncharacterized protein n=1 Tax=Odynerus spinipes TaxID=1348599 RepID=A0AAD9VPH4_9HYME|nr:hypothetical protein KPH14_004565 [Odynerus spinipes]